MLALSPGPARIDLVEPKARLDFIRETLGDNRAIKLTVTEALEFNPQRDRIGQKVPGEGDEKRALAHSLTIERVGSGYRVQDVAVDVDGHVAISELLVTRKGKFVWQEGVSRCTDSRDLGAIEEKERPRSGQQIYQWARVDSLLDRLVLGSKETNDVLRREPIDGITNRKKAFDQTVKSALEHFDPQEVARMLKAHQINHAFSGIVGELLPLVGKRAAQVALSQTIHEHGLEGFFFSGNDLNGLRGK
jgi:hypothetical protein